MYSIENWLTRDLRFDVSHRVRGVENAQLQVVYGYGQAWFGQFLAAFTNAGLGWFEPHPQPDAEQRLLKHWAPAVVERDQQQIDARLMSMLNSTGESQKLHLCGTAWQLRVWDALLCVPRTGTVSYGDLAQMLGNQRAARALGNAVGANNIAILVPCHRVKPASGRVGKYRWGADLKNFLLQFEVRPAVAAA